MIIRYAKIALTASSSFFLLLVAYNNVTDYDSNFQFVKNVLNMSTTVPGNKLMWRAMNSPAIHHAFYASIILWELAAAAVIAAGVKQLWSARGASAAVWHRAKVLASAGLVLSLLQWFVAFITVGGEWFLMWQSPTWNGQTAAFRMFAIFGLGLIYLNQPDDELAR